MRICFAKLLLLILLFNLVNQVTAQTKLSLQQALQAAKKSNSFLQAEYYAIDIAKADITTAKLRPNPVLNNQSLQLMNAAYFAPNTKRFNAQNQQIWWQLTKPFQIGGQRKYKIELADKNLLVTQNSYTETERNLFSEVAAKWLDVWVAAKQVDVITIAKTNIDSLLQINKFRFEKEVISKTDLYRTELLANQYALQYKTVSQQLTNRLNELKYLLGSSNDVMIDTADNYLFNIPADIESLLNKAVNERSDVLQIKSALDAANSNIKLQKALAIPQPELGFIYNPQNTIPYFGVYATIDLPFFSRNQGEQQKSLVLKKQAEKQLTTIKNKLHTEVTTAYASYQLHQQNLDKYKDILIQSQIILNNVKYAYLQTGTTIIDFLEAQRSWLETQQQFYDAQQAFRLSYIQLLHATGLINQLAQR